MSSFQDGQSVPWTTTTAVRAKYRLPAAATTTTASDHHVGSVGWNPGTNDVPQLPSRNSLDYYYRMFGDPTHCFFRNVHYRRMFNLFVSAILHKLPGQHPSRMPAMSHSLGLLQTMQLVTEESAAMSIRWVKHFHYGTSNWPSKSYLIPLHVLINTGP